MANSTKEGAKERKSERKKKEKIMKEKRTKEKKEERPKDIYGDKMLNGVELSKTGKDCRKGWKEK